MATACLRLFYISLLAIACACATTDIHAEIIGKLRTWQSSQNDKTIEARAIEIHPGQKKVQLERADGMHFTLNWDQLSTADQTLLAEASKSSMKRAPTPSIDQAVKETQVSELPETWTLKDVAMVVQKGNFCVPASATMIAEFHGVQTDQDQVADLSSEMSANNEGTYPRDMLLAMEKLGFRGKSVQWQNKEDFLKNALPLIRRTLFETGPIYISFRPNVFGTMGHGCVIVGYDDRKEELFFYNPWGNEFAKSYDRVGFDGYGIVLIEAPAPAPVATEAYVAKIKAIVPQFDGNFLALSDRLQRASQAHKLIWCSRQDARHDKSYARDTARDDGRTILELAFERNPAVFIPMSQDGITQEYLFVTRPPEGGARFLVRRITARGWSQAELQTLGSLTRNWMTIFQLEASDEKIWELPMIELHPDPSL